MQITLDTRTNKNPKPVGFRVRNGRSFNITYSAKYTHIIASSTDLAKLDNYGQPRRGVQIYNVDLVKQIEQQRAIIAQACERMIASGVEPTASNLLAAAQRLQEHEAQKAPKTLLELFDDFKAAQEHAGVIKQGRARHYKVLAGMLQRYCTLIKRPNINPSEVDAQFIVNFWQFVLQEGEHAAKRPDIFAESKAQNKTQTTAAHKIKILKPFFGWLVTREYIAQNPFDKLTKQENARMVHTYTKEPFWLTIEELKRIQAAAIPAALEEARDTFLVQCAIGARVGDFAQMTAQNVEIHPAGFAFVHYVPNKTAERQTQIKETTAPLVPWAWDIIERKGFVFPLLRNVYGVNGYNHKIKQLLKACNIDRPVTQQEEGAASATFCPIYEVASTHTARKTHVNAIARIPRYYSDGLHAEGSSAIGNYFGTFPAEDYERMCKAFEIDPQPYNPTAAALEGIRTANADWHGQIALLKTVGYKRLPKAKTQPQK